MGYLNAFRCPLGVVHSYANRKQMGCFVEKHFPENTRWKKTVNSAKEGRQGK